VNPVVFYEIDYAAVELFFKRVEKCFEGNEEGLLKSLDQLIGLVQFEFTQDRTRDKALMLWRAMLIFLINDKLTWDWGSLLETINKSLMSVIEYLRSLEGGTRILEEFINETIS
jgi:hypothetical protein